MAFRLAFGFLAFLLLAFPAKAVDFEEKTRVGEAELVLNGAGLRKRFFFEVYAIGLYLPKKARSAAEAIAAPGPKRVRIHMLRDVGADQFSQALVDGLRANVDEAQFKALEPRVQQLTGIMAGMKEAKSGMTIALDWTGAATRVEAAGKPAGVPIPGEDFYRALLAIWLGEHPVQDDLKKSLLGG